MIWLGVNTSAVGFDAGQQRRRGCVLGFEHGTVLRQLQPIPVGTLTLCRVSLVPALGGRPRRFGVSSIPVPYFVTVTVINYVTVTVIASGVKKPGHCRVVI